MGFAERVSRRNILSSTTTAVEAVQQCMAAIDGLVTEADRQRRQLTDITSRLDSQKAGLAAFEEGLQATGVWANHGDLHAKDFDALSFWGRLRWLFTGRTS